MAINTSREEARLKASTEALAKAETSVEVLRAQGLKEAADKINVVEIQNSYDLKLAIISALNSAAMETEKERDAAVQEVAKYNDLDAKRNGILEELKGAEEEALKLRATLAEKQAAKRLADDNYMNALALVDAALFPLRSKVAAQQAALARKQAEYPAKLSAHLRRCQKHGLVDARASRGGKK
jgi:hypothetical protein